ncbi:FGGY family carbohydrate kinase, partial [uncultured Cyclobacterium sp.]
MNPNNQYLMAMDQGTTSSRAIIFNKEGQIVASAQKDFEQFFPKTGWVE